MFGWLSRNGSAPRSGRRLSLAGRRALEGLARREARLRELLERFEMAAGRARAEMEERARQLEWELEQAAETIRKYEADNEALRDQVAVRDQTIEAQEARHRRLVELCRADTAEAVARQRLGLPGREE